MDLPEDSGGGLLAEAKAGDNAPALSVTELSMSLKRTIETSYGRVRVRGEISGFKRHASGHCYFSLKDEGACMDAVVWRSSAQSLAFRPEDGAEVIATGKLTTYPGRSKYQIMVERMELAGEGALMALLDKRRRALAAEGLFDAERKPERSFGTSFTDSRTGARHMSLSGRSRCRAREHPPKSLRRSALFPPSSLDQTC
jgi:exodeoxyribonuclease VII large subunit